MVHQLGSVGKGTVWPLYSRIFAVFFLNFSLKRPQVTFQHNIGVTCSFGGACFCYLKTQSGSKLYGKLHSLLLRYTDEDKHVFNLHLFYFQSTDHASDLVPFSTVKNILVWLDKPKTAISNFPKTHHVKYWVCLFNKPQIHKKSPQ